MDKRTSGRPAHPSKHDPRIVKLLEECLGDEVFLPVQDHGAVRLMRSRIREIIRAHKVWETGRHKEFSHVSTKIVDTLRAQVMRSNYIVDPERLPLTLIIDGREKLAESLDQALVTGTAYPVIGPVNLARADDPETPDSAEEEAYDPYLELTDRYARRTTE